MKRFSERRNGLILRLENWWRSDPRVPVLISLHSLAKWRLWLWSERKGIFYETVLNTELKNIEKASLFNNYHSNLSIISEQAENFRTPPILHLLFHSSTPATEQKPENQILYICGLGASVGCERISEHLTRRDESHKYALFISLSSSIFTVSQIKIPLA